MITAGKVGSRKGRSRIPKFKTIEEEAAFWDTHDTTEFEDEFESVDVILVPAGPKKRVTVRLDEQTFAALRALAQKEGTAPATLARIWITKRVREEAAEQR